MLGSISLNDELEQAYYFCLEQSRRGMSLEQIRAGLLAKGWQPGDVEHLLHRVQVQQKGTSAPPPVPEKNWNSRPVGRRSDNGHTSKAFNHLIGKLSDGTLDLEKVNVKGPLLLIAGGLILTLGLLGVMLLIALQQGSAVKAMIIPVLIGVTFLKAGIDTYRHRI